MNNKIISTRSSLIRQWKKSLKCAVCLSIFKEPHTLPCGHTFCFRCLGHLTRLAQDQLPNIPRRKLKIRCPTCRRALKTCEIIQEKACVNYVIRNMVENYTEQKIWISKRQKYDPCLRSFASQTLSQKKEMQDLKTPVDSEISLEEYKIVRSFYTDYRHSDSSEEELVINGDGTLNITPSNHKEYDETSSDGSDSEAEVENWRIGVGFAEDINEIMPTFIRDFNIMNSIAQCFTSPARLAMTLFWCGYTLIVIIIANGFLPYILLYSFLFILIFHTE